MNGRDEELLSAYFDGELTGDEQARAEQLLAEHSAAREALDEMAEVSNRLRDLPRLAAPAGMREDVLRRLRARSIPVRAPATARRPRWRRPAAWIGSVAAGLLVAVVVYQQWPERPPTAVRQSAAGTAVAMRDSTVPADGLSPLAPFGAVSSSGETGLDAYHLNLEHGLRTRYSGESETLGVSPQNTTTLALTNAGAIQDKFQLIVESGNGLVPGQVYSNESQVDGQVVVTQHRVVDTEKLLGQIQVVLTDNGIVTLPDSETDSNLRGRVVADMKENSRLQAIYVEAPTTNFNNAVDQIARLTSVTNVSANTVFFDELDAAKEGRAVEKKLDVADAADKQSRLHSFSTAAVSESRSRHDASGPVDAPKPELSTASAAPLPLTSLGYQQQHAQEPPPPPQSDRRYLYFGTQEESPRITAYQVIVPARRELLEELQQQPSVVFDVEQGAAVRAEKVATARQPQSQVQRCAWNMATPGIKAAPVDPDRIRAVILLVPEQGK